MRRARRWGGVFGVLLLLLCTTVWAAVSIRPGGNRFDSNGTWLYFKDYQGEGEPIILLHGFALNGRTGWEVRGVPWVLSRTHRVIALDQRGHGRSGTPHDPSKYGVEMAHDVIRLMDHLKIEKAHVAGYSMGGFVALKVASLYPDRLLSVAVCGAGFEKPEGENLTALTRISQDIDARRDYGALAKFLEPGRKDPSWIKVRVMNAFIRVENDDRALSAVLRGFPQLAVPEAELRRCRVPMLTVIGSKDPFLPAADALHELVPGHSLTVVGGRDHMNTMVSGPFRESLVEFLKQHPDTLPVEAVPLAAQP